MSDKEKILIIRVGRAGDLVMITPALRALLRHYPESEFHLMVGQDSAHVLKNFDPRITRVHVYDRRFLRNWKRKNTLKNIENQHYSKVFALETNPYYHKLAENICSDVYCVDNSVPNIHYSQRCLEAVQKSLPEPLERDWISLPVTPEGRAQAEDVLHRAGVSPDTLLVGMHLGNSTTQRLFSLKSKDRLHREWPLRKFAELAQRLVQYGKEQNLPLKVVVDILPEEQALGQELLSLCKGTVTLIQSPPNFERYKAMLERLSVLVTSNTGPMHIAAAVGTPVVALFSGWSIMDCGPFVAESQYSTLCAEDMDQSDLGLAAIPPDKTFQACLPFIEKALSSESGKVLYNESKEPANLLNPSHPTVG